MEEKDLEQRLRHIESIIFSNPNLHELRRRVLELEGKLQGSVNNPLVEKVKDLEQKLISYIVF